MKVTLSNPHVSMSNNEDGEVVLEIQSGTGLSFAIDPVELARALQFLNDRREVAAKKKIRGAFANDRGQA